MSWSPSTGNEPYPWYVNNVTGAGSFWRPEETMVPPPPQETSTTFAPTLTTYPANPIMLEPVKLEPSQTELLEEWVNQQGGWGWALLKLIGWSGLALLSLLIPDFVQSFARLTWRKIKQLWRSYFQ